MRLPPTATMLPLPPSASGPFGAFLLAALLSGGLVAVLIPCLLVAPLLTYWILTTALESASR